MHRNRVDNFPQVSCNAIVHKRSNKIFVTGQHPGFGGWIYLSIIPAATVTADPAILGAEVKTVMNINFEEDKRPVTEWTSNVAQFSSEIASIREVTAHDNPPQIPAKVFLKLVNCTSRTQWSTRRRWLGLFRRDSINGLRMLCTKTVQVPSRSGRTKILRTEDVLDETYDSVTDHPSLMNQEDKEFGELLLAKLGGHADVESYREELKSKLDAKKQREREKKEREDPKSLIIEGSRRGKRSRGDQDINDEKTTRAKRTRRHDSSSTSSNDNDKDSKNADETNTNQSTRRRSSRHRSRSPSRSSTLCSNGSVQKNQSLVDIAESQLRNSSKTDPEDASIFALHTLMVLPRIGPNTYAKCKAVGINTCRELIVMKQSDLLAASVKVSRCNLTNLQILCQSKYLEKGGCVYHQAGENDIEDVQMQVVVEEEEEEEEEEEKEEKKMKEKPAKKRARIHDNDDEAESIRLTRGGKRARDEQETEEPDAPVFEWSDNESDDEEDRVEVYQPVETDPNELTRLLNQPEWFTMKSEILVTKSDRDLFEACFQARRDWLEAKSGTKRRRRKFHYTSYNLAREPPASMARWVADDGMIRLRRVPYMQAFATEVNDALLNSLPGVLTEVVMDYLSDATLGQVELEIPQHIRDQAVDEKDFQAMTHGNWYKPILKSDLTPEGIAKKREVLKASTGAGYWSGNALDQLIRQALLREEQERINMAARTVYFVEIDLHQLEYRVRTGAKHIMDKLAHAQLFAAVRGLVGRRFPHDLSKYNDAVIATIEDAKTSDHDNTRLKSLANFELYSYQKATLAWMRSIEAQVDRGDHLELDESDMVLPGIDTSLKFDHVRQRMYIDVPDRRISFKGGVLADQMGLGKTFSAISLLLMNPSNTPCSSDSPSTEGKYKFVTNATLIVSPSHLVQQWAKEIDKFCTVKLSVHTVTTMREHKMLTYGNIIDADVVIVSTSFFQNANYYKLYNKASTKSRQHNMKMRMRKMLEKQHKTPIMPIIRPLFDHFQWRRIILDEGHELFGAHGAKGISVIENLMGITSQYRWYLTGTPFPDPFMSVRGAARFLDVSLNGRPLWHYEPMTDKAVIKAIKNELGNQASAEDYANYHFELASEDIVSCLLSPFGTSLDRLFYTRLFIRHTKESIGEDYNVVDYIDEVCLMDFHPVERGVYDSVGRGAANDQRRRQLCCHIQLTDEERHTLGDDASLDEATTRMVWFLCRQIAENLKAQSQRKQTIASTQAKLAAGGLTPWRVSSFTGTLNSNKKALTNLRHEIRVNFKPKLKYYLGINFIEEKQVLQHEQSTLGELWIRAVASFDDLNTRLPKTPSVKKEMKQCELHSAIWQSRLDTGVVDSKSDDSGDLLHTGKFDQDDYESDDELSSIQEKDLDLHVNPHAYYYNHSRIGARLSYVSGPQKGAPTCDGFMKAIALNNGDGVHGSKIQVRAGDGSEQCRGLLSRTHFYITRCGHMFCRNCIKYQCQIKKCLCCGEDIEIPDLLRIHGSSIRDPAGKRDEVEEKNNRTKELVGNSGDDSKKALSVIAKAEKSDKKGQNDQDDDDDDGYDYVNHEYKGPGWKNQQIGGLHLDSSDDEEMEAANAGSVFARKSKSKKLQKNMSILKKFVGLWQRQSMSGSSTSSSSSTSSLSSSSSSAMKVDSRQEDVKSDLDSDLEYDSEDNLDNVQQLTPANAADAASTPSNVSHAMKAGVVVNSNKLLPLRRSYSSMSKEEREKLFTLAEGMRRRIKEKVVQLRSRLHKRKFQVSESKRNQYGTKMAHIIGFIQQITKEDPEARIIIFSQWHRMLELVGHTLQANDIPLVFCKGNVMRRNKAIRLFYDQNDVRIIMLSLENAASGTNLQQASHIILLDPVAGTREEARSIEGQAIGRAHRQGQDKQVTVTRFIINNTIEYELWRRNQ